jgi:hypothetical protein
MMRELWSEYVATHPATIQTPEEASGTSGSDPDQVAHNPAGPFRT